MAKKVKFKFEKSGCKSEVTQDFGIVLRFMVRRWAGPWIAGGRISNVLLQSIFSFPAKFSILILIVTFPNFLLPKPFIAHLMNNHYENILMRILKSENRENFCG